MSPSGKDEFYVLEDETGAPRYLLWWPSAGYDVSIWVPHRSGWAPAWPHAMASIGPGTTEQINSDALDDYKAVVADISDHDLASWGQNATGEPLDFATFHALTSRPTTGEFPVRFNTDMDSDRWMHTDDPRSVDWVVTTVGRGPGQSEPRLVRTRQHQFPGFPALNWHISLSAWDVEQPHCHIEILDEQGDLHAVNPCPHTSP